MSTDNKINSNFYQVAVVDGNADVTGLTVADITATTSANLGTVTAVTITGGINGQVLTTNGSGSLSWSTPAPGGVTSVDVSGGTTGLTTSGGPITSSGTITIAGTLTEANGGTNQTTYAAGDLLYATSTNILGKLNAGSDGKVLTISTGLPIWASLPASVTTFSTSLDGLTPTTGTSGAVTLAGTLGAISGGTSQSTYATGDILYASNTNTLSKLPIGSGGQVLTVSAGVPAWAAGGGGSGGQDLISYSTCGGA